MRQPYTVKIRFKKKALGDKLFKLLVEKASSALLLMTGHS
jgi:hypothetical protein